MKDIYFGSNLDILLMKYGFERNSDENDWDFRKRIFPELHQKNPRIAWEILVAKRSKEWPGLLKYLAAVVIYFIKPSHEFLEKYVGLITADPSAPPEPWQLSDVGGEQIE